jgi:monoamine oxidase
MPKIAIVGAGIAGLTAAVDLVEGGADVVVLEARERVGGRMYGIEVAPGNWADAGAAYLGDRHTAVLETMALLGLRTTPTTVAGASRFAFGADAVSSSGRFPPLSAVALGELFELLDGVTKAVELDAPWLTPDAAYLDTLTAAAWADENLTHPDARTFFPLFLGEMMAADPADVSVLHMAFYLRSGGGLRYLNAFEGGAQQDRVHGGAHRLCEELAVRLGDRVHLAEPVSAIHQADDRVSVVSSAGTTYADVAVVALPPLLADHLDFRPGLPAPRAGVHTGRGCAVKVHLVYPTPLWRDHGLSGWSMSAGGPVLSTVDDSPVGGAGVLTGFVTGAEARRFSGLPPEDQRAEALAQAQRLFPELPEPTGFFVTDWLGDPYSKGCYAALFGPGDWLNLGPRLTTPHGRVHWAGTETSLEFFGLIEGAIRSGHRAARDVLALC